MDEQTWMAELFENHRERLEQVARRILVSTGDAADAVQEAWLRFSRTEAQALDNLAGWLTPVVARICRKMARARRSRGEEPEENGVTVAERNTTTTNTEQDASV